MASVARDVWRPAAECVLGEDADQLAGKNRHAGHGDRRTEEELTAGDEPADRQGDGSFDFAHDAYVLLAWADVLRSIPMAVIGSVAGGERRETLDRLP